VQDFAAARPDHRYRDLSAKTEQPLHLGLTEAGMGMKGQIWSAASLGVCFMRASATRFGSRLRRDRRRPREEVYGRRVIAAGVGPPIVFAERTAVQGAVAPQAQRFRNWPRRIQDYIRDMMPIWKTQYEGVETMTLAGDMG